MTDLLIALAALLVTVLILSATGGKHNTED